MGRKETLVKWVGELGDGFVRNGEMDLGNREVAAMARASTVLRSFC